MLSVIALVTALVFAAWKFGGPSSPTSVPGLGKHHVSVGLTLPRRPGGVLTDRTSFGAVAGAGIELGIQCKHLSTGGSDYDEQFAALSKAGESVTESYWQLVIQDIEAALTALR